MFDEEVAKWLQDLRQKARVSIYRIPEPVPEDRTPGRAFGRAGAGENAGSLKPSRRSDR